MRPLLFSLVAAASLLAAPAPFLDPGKRGPWFDGWDAPTNPCPKSKIERRSGELSIELSDRGHTGSDESLVCPRLIRTVKDDFTLEVRVRGDFKDRATPATHAFFAAGICLTDGVEVMRLSCQRGHRLDVLDDRFSGMLLAAGLCQRGKRTGIAVYDRTTEFAHSAWFRVARRGGDIALETSADGTKWECHDHGLKAKFPGPVQVGVYAEATKGVGLRAVFDRLKITVPPK